MPAMQAKAGQLSSRSSLVVPPPLHSPKLHLSCPVTTIQRKTSACPVPATLALHRRLEQCCQAAASGATASDSGKSEPKDGGLVNTLLLGGLFASWYLANIWFNLYNKQVLKVFPFPITCTLVQFFLGSVIACTCWATGVVKKPNLNTATLKSVAPLAVVHTLGNLLTNVSLGAVAVSFTHTIKAMEPFFSVALSTIFLGDKPSIPVLLTLLPIVGGVGMASLAEASFNWTGFLSAMGSNLTFQSRNVLSKKVMLKKKDSNSLDNLTLFAVITVLSFFLLLPISLLLEGFQLTPQGLQAMGITDPVPVLTKTALAGLMFHTYQQVSYMILARVSPVTHSIGNCVKRVVVIVASVVFFQNPMSTQNALGTALALLGVFAYSQVKRLSGKAKA